MGNRPPSCDPANCDSLPSCHMSEETVLQEVDRRIAEAQRRQRQLDEELAALCERRRELVREAEPGIQSMQTMSHTSTECSPMTRIATRKSFADRMRKQQTSMLARASTNTFSKVLAKHVTVYEKLGEGDFGAVYRAEWRGIPLALKFLTNATKDDKEECLDELRMLDTLEHPNVIRVYGLCDGEAPSKWPQDARPPCIASEFMSHGTFISFLAKVPLESRCGLDHWIKVIGMLKGAANGLGYLHSMGVLHCDLKGENLLLDGEDCLKLADFGLAMARDMIPTRSEAIGTYTHMAPEIMNNQFDQWDTCSDIFSFGICITEAIAGICNTEDVCIIAEEIIEQTRTKDFGLNEEGVRSFLDSYPHPPVGLQLCDVAADCCAMDNTDRPSAFGLIAKLETLEDLGVDAGEENDYRIASLRATRDKLMHTLKMLEKSEAQSSVDSFERSIGRSKKILQDVHETNVKLALVKKVRQAVLDTAEDGI